MNLSVANIWKVVKFNYPFVVAFAVFAFSLLMLRKFFFWQFWIWPMTALWANTVWIAGIASFLCFHLLTGWRELRRAKSSQLSDATRDLSPTSVVLRLKSFLPLLLLFWTQLLCWYWGEFPGRVHSEEITMMYRTSLGQVDPFLSVFYAIHAMTVHRFGLPYPALGLMTIGICSWVLADMFSLLIHFGLKLRYALPFVLLVVTSIPLGFCLIYLSHDILTGCLKISLVAVMLRVLVGSTIEGKPVLRIRTIVTLGLLTTCVAMLRGENLLLLLWVPILLWATRHLRLGSAIAYAASMILVLMGFRLIIEPALYPDKLSDVRRRYAVTLFASPLRFMLQNSYYSPTPEADREAIFAVFSKEAILGQDTNNFDIGFFWVHGVVEPLTDKKIERLREVYISSALNNPAIFGSNRVLVFLGCLGGTSNTWYPVQFDREMKSDDQLYGEQKVHMLNRGLQFDRENPDIVARCTHVLRDWSAPRGIKSPGYWIWNTTPAFLLSLLTVVTWKRHPLSASLASILMVPLVLTFLGAPACHFKYLTDLYIFGFLIIPILIFEHTALKKVSAEAHIKTA